MVAILSTHRGMWRKEEEGGAAELGDDGDRSQLSIASDSVLKRVVKERKAYSHPIHKLYMTPFTYFTSALLTEP